MNYHFTQCTTGHRGCQKYFYRFSSLPGVRCRRRCCARIIRWESWRGRHAKWRALKLSICHFRRRTRVSFVVKRTNKILRAIEATTREPETDSNTINIFRKFPNRSKQTHTFRLINQRIHRSNLQCLRIEHSRHTSETKLKFQYFQFFQIYWSDSISILKRSCFSYIYFTEWLRVMHDDGSNGSLTQADRSLWYAYIDWLNVFMIKHVCTRIVYTRLANGYNIDIESRVRTVIVRILPADESQHVTPRKNLVFHWVVFGLWRGLIRFTGPIPAQSVKVQRTFNSLLSTANKHDFLTFR